MTGEFRIGVNPASMRIVASDAVPPGTGWVAERNGRISQFFPARVKPVEFMMKLDADQMAATMRLFGQRFQEVGRSIRAWTYLARPTPPPAPARPTLPTSAPVQRARLNRIYTAQRHVHRRALCRHRHALRVAKPRQVAFHAPRALVWDRPDGTLEAQLLAYQPGD